jgi:hypothetical protein
MNAVKSSACGGRKGGKGSTGVRAMDSGEITMFIERQGTAAAKDALFMSKKPVSRGALCVILHSFRAGRELIQQGGAASNFRLTPSPNRMAPVPVQRPRVSKTMFRPGGKRVNVTVSNASSNENVNTMLNKLMKKENKKESPKKFYFEYPFGVKIAGRRPRPRPVRRNNAPSSSSSSSSNRNNRMFSNGSGSGSSGSNRGNSNFGSNGNGNNPVNYTNTAAKPTEKKKEAKAKNTNTRFEKKKKKKLKPGVKLVSEFKKTEHGMQGRPTRKVSYMNVPASGANNATRRVPTRPKGLFTHGSGSRPTKNQLRIADRLRWNRYAEILSKEPQVFLNTQEKRNKNAERRSALANRLYFEAIEEVRAGKHPRSPPKAPSPRPLTLRQLGLESSNSNSNTGVRKGVKGVRAKLTKLLRRRRAVPQSEAARIFANSYMTGLQKNKYYPPSRAKKNSPSSSSSSSNTGSRSGSNSNRNSPRQNQGLAKRFRKATAKVNKLLKVDPELQSKKVLSPPSRRSSPNSN